MVKGETGKGGASEERLRAYWAEGKGAAKIHWGTPGDFKRMEHEAEKYMSPGKAAGFAANEHHRALGVWPGQEDGGRKRKKK